MIINADYLDKKWSEINYQNGGYLRVDADHLLDWYVGINDTGQKTLLLLSGMDMGVLPSSKSILITHRKREQDGKWTLSFDLMRNEQDNVFSTLCSDIIVFSQDAKSEQNAIDSVKKRYKQWHKLLEHQRKSLMEESSRKGLLGELLFLINQISIGMDRKRAIYGWVGPEGADQDFIFFDKWYEIKSIGLSEDKVSISSLEQLNNTDYGELVIMHIDKCAPEKAGAVSLAEVVKNVQHLYVGFEDEMGILEQKLLKYGYIDLPEYFDQKYYYAGNQHYVVNHEFPKLVSKNIPPQIISAQYSISLPSIENWKV